MRSILCVLFVLLHTAAFAQVPRTISFQGVLTDAAGNLVQDGNHPLTLRLYAGATGGSSLYTESQTVPVVKGIFNVIIGSVTPIPVSIGFGQAYFLGVSVDGGAELSPRSALTAVPYSLRAAVADEVAPGASGVVTHINGISGDVALIGGGSTTVTQSGNNLLISSTGGSGGNGIQGVQNNDGTIAVVNPNGPVATIGVPDQALTLQKLDYTGAVSGQAPVFDGSGLQWRHVATSEGIQTVSNTDGTMEITNPNGPVATIGIKAGGITTAHMSDNAVPAAKINSIGSAAGDALLSNGTPTPVWGRPTAGDLVLPFAKTQADAASLFSITNSGDGKAAFFQADNTNSYTGVLEATTAGPGLVAKFSNTNTTAFASTAVQISSAGSSIGLQVYGGGGAGWFLPGYPGGIYASSGNGFAVQGSSASGAGVYGGASTGTGVYAQARGTGNGLIAVSESGGVSTTTTGNIALFKNTVNAGNVARIDNTGRGYFNGGTQISGADLAEAFKAGGALSTYEPGDVLVISTSVDMRIEKSAIPYSTLVAGVYATKPGVLLSEEHIDTKLEGSVPVGMVGVIPTKVCGENGAIHRGDLLVTSSTSGCAMKADPARLQFGMIIGKALENFTDIGVGKIKVLVNPK